MVQYFTGTSGWHYEHWKERFYPPILSKSHWLQFYAEHFNTVEINNSFYHLPTEKAFATWYRTSPATFTFAIKVSRYITHVKRLNDCEEPLNKFFNLAEMLQQKLGPLLYQLPPNMHRNDDRLESLLSILPDKYRHVFEFRHESWFHEDIFDILREYNAGFCIFDMPELTCPVISTADFAYVRFHGKDSLYASNYSDKQLMDWASALMSLAKTKHLKSVYAYFNNDNEAFAVKNAVTLHQYLK
jgi:uncharacterized protein YecE (DUF72 family)